MFNELFDLKNKISSNLQRPPSDIIDYKCERCEKPIKLKLEYWRLMDEPYNGKYWIQQTALGTDKNDRLCVGCLDHRIEIYNDTQELLADTPPEWFDEANIGEHWREDD